MHRSEKHAMRTEKYWRRLADAKVLVDALDGRVKRVLHRWCGDNGTELKEALAEALETSRGTVSRQIQPRDLPVQMRLLAALRIFEPALYREVIGEMECALGDAWTCASEDTDTQRTASAVRQSARAGALLAAHGHEILDDDQITLSEARAHIELLDEAEQALAKTRRMLLAHCAALQSQQGVCLREAL